MKPIRLLSFGLLPRVLVAIAVGIVLGAVLPLWGARCAATVSDLFSQLLSFIIPLIIIGLVTPAIANLGRVAGRLLLITVVIAYADTVCTGLLSLATSVGLFPHLLGGGSAATAAATEAAVEPLFHIDIAPPVAVITALLLAIMMGLGVSATGASTLRQGFNELHHVVELTIVRAIIPMLPVYICCLFVVFTFTGQAWQIAKTFVSIIGVIFAMHIALLLLQYTVAGVVAGVNPLRALRTILPAYATALGTSSSAATIPVTLRQTERMGVDTGVAAFVVPLCATIHLSGSTMKITSCAVALMLLGGMSIDPLTMVGFVMMLGVMMVAAPGVPGGAIMAALGILQSMLGFDASQQALMVALYITMDSFGTACNVAGDGAIALVIHRINRRHHVVADGGAE